MCRLVLVLIGILIISEVYSQSLNDPNSGPHKVGVSVFASSNFFAYIGNVSLDHFIDRGDKRILGYTAGFSVVGDPNGYSSYGGHLTFTMLSRRSKGFIESKFGIVHVPFGFESGSWFHSLKTYPVLSIGYRFQKPGSPVFTRIAFGIGGIGVGFGVNIK